MDRVRSDPPSARQTATIGGGTIAVLTALVALLQSLGVLQVLPDGKASEMRQARATEKREQDIREREAIRTDVEVIKARLLTIDRRLEEQKKQARETRQDVKEVSSKVDGVNANVKRLLRRPQ